MNGYAPPGGAGRPQSRGEEVANAASHGAALAAALVAGYWLVAWGRSLSAEGFAGVCVFVADRVGDFLTAALRAPGVARKEKPAHRPFLVPSAGAQSAGGRARRGSAPAAGQKAPPNPTPCRSPPGRTA